MSKPIEHSPGPWKEGSVGQHLGIKDSEKRAVAAFMQQHYPKNADLELMLAAPDMYRIIRQICHTDWQCREQGLRSAQFLLQELEGRSDAES